MSSKSILSLICAVSLSVALASCSELTNRDDFVSMIKNKNEAAVLKLAGKPLSVDSSKSDHVVWIYKSRTFVVEPRKTDEETDVIFTPAPDGTLHVASVEFK